MNELSVSVIYGAIRYKLQNEFSSTCSRLYTNRGYIALDPVRLSSIQIIRYIIRRDIQGWLAEVMVQGPSIADIYC